MTNKLNVNDLIDKHPLSASVLSKLVVDKNMKKNIDYSRLNYTEVIEATKAKIKSNEEVIKLFPDTELAMQIVITSIISPNDLTNTSMKLTIPDIPLPSTIKNQVIDVIESYLDKNYNIFNKVYTIVREALFTKGAYIEVCVPESSLDRIINGELYQLSIEQFAHSNNFMFNNNEVTAALSLESFSIVNKNLYKKNTIGITPKDFNIEFIEDMNILKYSDNKLKSIAKENKKIKPKEKEESESFLNKFFKTLNPNENKPIEFILREEETSRTSIGLPFITKVPTEAVIPIYSSNDASKHVGYFLILDENGNFIDMENEKKDFNNCNNYINHNFKDMLIDKAKRNLEGFTTNVPEIENMEILYNDIIEELIKNRLRNSKYEDLVDIGKTTDIYKVMLSRSLKNRRTKLLFVPSDLLQYYAFNFRNNGTGESLIEKSSYLFSIAGLLLMCNLVANIQNAIPQTEVNVKIDEHETDLPGAISKIQESILKLRQLNFPIGTTDVNSITNWVQRAGLKFSYENPNLPDTKINFESANLNKSEVDKDFLEYIIAMINKSFGVTPEMVDAGKEKEFATSISTDNMLFAKRIIGWQIQLEPMLTKHIRMIMNNDNVLKEKISNIVLNAKKEIKDKMKDIAKNKDMVDDELEKVKDKFLVDYIVEFFFNNIEAELARPEFNDNAVINENFNNFITKVEKLTDLLVSDNTFIGRYYKNLGESASELQQLVKSELILNYITKNNIFPELTDWFTMDENNKPINPIFDNHLGFAYNTINQYNGFLKDLYDKNKDIIPEFNKRASAFEKIENIEGGDTFGGTDDFGTDSDSSDSFGDDSFDTSIDEDLGDDLGTKDDNNDEQEEDLDELTVDDVVEEDKEK